MTDAPTSWRLAAEDIQAQPDVLARLWQGLPAQWATLPWPDPPDAVWCVAEGSSHAAASAVAPVLSAWMGRPVSVWTSDQLQVRLAWPPASEGGTRWLLVLSQSGRTSCLRQAVADFAARYPHDPLWTLTNAPDSPLASGPWPTVHLQAGPEQVIPATRSVTATMVGLLALARQAAARWGTLGADDELWGARLARLPEAMTLVLGEAMSAAEAAWVDALADAPEAILLSMGLPAGLLPEIALKWLEMARLRCWSADGEAFRHGPKLLLGRALPDAPAPAVVYWLPQGQEAELSALVRDHFWTHGRPVFRPGRVLVWQEAVGPLTDSAPWADLQPTVAHCPGPSTDSVTALFVGLGFAQRVGLSLARRRGVSVNPDALSKAVENISPVS